MTPFEMRSIRRRVRVVLLLDAAEAAGLVPIGILRLHAFAYLANVLAPVWRMPALQGALLKRQGGPFYPDLQHDVDRLVGMGVVLIEDVGYVKDEGNRWRLDGRYKLNRKFADPILSVLGSFEHESREGTFILELAYALAALSDADLDRAFKEDATYSDPMVAANNVIDFEARRARNYSANAALRFDKVIAGNYASPGEKLHLYVRHLQRRMHGER